MTEPIKPATEYQLSSEIAPVLDVDLNRFEYDLFHAEGDKLKSFSISAPFGLSIIARLRAAEDALSALRSQLAEAQHKGATLAEYQDIAYAAARAAKE